MTYLGFYKLSPNSPEPVFSTSHSACFDIAAYLEEGANIKMLDYYNDPVQNSKVVDNKITLFGGCRALIPTGLVFSIPSGYSLRLHPRSGLAWKNGIALANCEGIIDSDYYHETFVALINTTEVDFEINNGDRIAQGEMAAAIETFCVQVLEKPTQSTNRSGGFGSTGLNKK
jgi:dUTP pyrophosphatase